MVDGNIHFCYVMIMVGVSLAVIGYEIRRMAGFWDKPRSANERGVAVPASVTTFALELARRMRQVGGLLAAGFLAALLVRALWV